MSNSHNQESRFWEVVEDSLRRTGRECFGKRYSKRDCDTYSVAVFLQGLALDDLLIDAIPNRRSRIIRWQKSTVMTEPAVVGSVLKSLISFFRNYGEEIIDYSGFKHLFRTDFPCIGDFMSPVKEEVESFLFNPTASSFTFINFHLQFISKLSLKDVDFSASSLEKYLEIERKLEIFEHNYPLYDELNVIMREWLSGFTYEDFHPHHGPGGVAHLGRCSSLIKYRELGTDPLLRYFCLRTEFPDYSVVQPKNFDRECEVVFVAKSMTSWRTISMEPATLQYYQQGIWGCLDKFMGHHKYLKRRIDLHDQSTNRLLAQEGSARRGLFSTIDLSDASDTVSWELVKRVFRGTELLRGCYATRSRSALLPDGSRVMLRKFAPMGSALCFPIECLVFACICEYALRKSAIRRVNVPYSVFGDDLVVRKEITRPVMLTLSACGFVINESKSFTRTDLLFRESCGGEYFGGVEVTPMRLGRNFSAESPSPKNPNVFQAYIDCANRAYMFGLRKTRLWFVHKLINLPEKLRPRFGDDFTCLYSDTPSNFHLKTRWHVDWQCHISDCGNSIPVAEVNPEVDEAIRLYEWLRLARFRRRACFMPGDVIRADITRPSSKLGTVKFSNYQTDTAL